MWLAVGYRICGQGGKVPLLNRRSALLCLLSTQALHPEADGRPTIELENFYLRVKLGAKELSISGREIWAALLETTPEIKLPFDKSNEIQGISTPAKTR